MVNGSIIEFPDRQQQHGDVTGVGEVELAEAVTPAAPANENALEQWEQAYEIWRNNGGIEPGPPPEIDDQTRYLVAVWRILLEDLKRLPPVFLESLIKDEIDPDDRAIYHNSEKHARRLCTLGDVRAMARVVRCTRILAKVLSMANQPGPGLPKSP